MSVSDPTFGALPQRVQVARGQRRVAYVNGWLVLILLVGAVIVMFDGATRAPIPDLGQILYDALGYQPYAAVYVFAAVTLPLVWGWAQSLGASKTEALLLWFVLGTVTYTRDFSYVKVPNAPIFVTDVVLAVLLISLFVWPRLRLVPLRSPYVRWILAFFLAGLIATLRGLQSGWETTRVLRDFALVLYPLYLLVTLYLFRSWEAILRAAHVFVLGCVLGSLNALAWFVATPGQRRYIAYGVYIAAALVAVMIAVMKRALPKAVGGPLLVVLGLGLILSNSRSAYAGLLVTLGLMFLAGAVAGSRMRLLPLVKGLAIAFAVTAIVALLLLGTRGGADYLQRTSGEFVSGVLQSENDDNAQFRLLAWAEAGARFVNNPVFGEGYGVPFVFDLANNDSRPHNTYLTVLYKMGILGVIPLLALLWLLFREGWHAFRFLRGEPGFTTLYALLLTQFLMCFFGFFNLLLESPFLASLFWMTAGAIIRSMRLIAQESPRSVGLPGRTATASSAASAI